MNNLNMTKGMEKYSSVFLAISLPIKAVTILHYGQWAEVTALTNAHFSLYLRGLN